MSDPKQTLKEIYGYDSFRPGQEPLIRAVLSGRDAMGIMPTGAGKSICFQIPALCMDGLTLVISPLISLMLDQVLALKEYGIRAAFMNSTLTPGQQRTVLSRAAEGAYQIMYVAPERLLQEQGRIKSKLPYNRETTDMFTLIGKDEDPLNEYPDY